MAEKKTTSSAKSATGITGASRGRPKQPVEDSEGEENEEEEDVDLDDEEEEEGEETEGSEEEEEAIRMFSNYDELKQEIADTEQQVEKVKRKMSDLVQSIHSSYGAGPFEWGGSILKISKRNDTYFFKSFTSKATKIGKS